MRIAFVCGFAWEPKGTVRARAHPLAAQLVKFGHEVTLFACPYDNPRYSGLEWVDEGVRIKNVEIPNYMPLGAFSALFEMLRLVEDLAPDVIHVFKPKGFTGIFAMIVQARSDRTPPMVLDCDDWEGWGGWNDVLNHPWAVKQFIDLQEKVLIRNTPAITVASRVLGDRVRDLSAGRSQSFYVPNCLSNERIASDAEILQSESRREALGLPDLPLLFYAGHFERAGDTMFLCSCLESLARSRRFALAVVGEGPELPEVRERLSSAGVATVFFGQTDFRKYRRILQASDIAVFPYPDTPIYRAKCSARILDYMSLEKPIVTTAVGQNKEYLVDGESGCLVAANNMTAFVDALERLIVDGDLRVTLGRNARHRLTAYFNWNGESIHNCLQAYRQVLT